MAITTNFSDVQKNFNSQYWGSIDEFEEYYLRRFQETMGDTNYYTDRHGEERKIGFIDHHPALNEYEVWMAGYVATGEHATAHLVGKVSARNFAQACDIVMCNQHLKSIKEDNSPDNTKYCPPRTWDYDPSELSVWGCRLYWSEELARKAFG